MYNKNNDVEQLVEEPIDINKNSLGIKPFLKWAGGKTQLLQELHKYIPANFNKYIEPFIGGGAMYFSINSNNSIIADSNSELIITYQQVRDQVNDVIEILSTFENNSEFYYDLRQKNPEELSNNYRAARLIYLNKTCFNGLYRVNKKGQFNVPYGKGNSNFLNKNNLKSASEFLSNTEIINDDYINILQNYAENNDFIFLDPPYHPVGKHSDFKRYTKDFFYVEDQIKLKNEFDRLVNLGCNVLLTNSDHEFILDLYSDYEIKIIETKRMISSNAKTRKGKDIIVIGRSRG
ncbi:DNA adenine methylase [Chryseobacterium sp. MEBOG07]|uniref:DNA adenine methylase n=1 Tax=Chryseobacterium sp. MEBOG07 TaxID=2879939 RepID=UPI001F01E237|nr:Dam family site-specific DNA-(adenine-N6)-methyltransferase [Chryseobacterium sp. MEBOG07]UKB81032.1 Dam family site-specific DNA-(adenine-N6)-methyltransferase [Chryseobacterium sp. MEBOG07]